MNRDCQLISEAYKKIDPNQNRFPIAPKFQVGDKVLVKKYRETKFIGNHSSRKPEDWVTTIYPNVLGEVTDIKAYPNPLKHTVPTYYFTIKFIDKRYPNLLEYDRIFATYELKKTAMTLQDTGDMKDLLDI